MNRLTNVYTTQIHEDEGIYLKTGGIMTSTISTKNGRDVIGLILYRGYIYIPCAREFTYGREPQGTY